MKKALKSVVAIGLISILCLSLAGCAKDIFKGNFTTEATAEELTSTFETLSYEDFATDKAIEISVKIEMTMEIMEGVTATTKATMDFVMAIADDNVIAAGKMDVVSKATMAGETATEKSNGKFYFTDGYMYLNGKENGETVKYKQEQDIYSFANIDLDESVGMLEEAIALMEEGAKIYIDNSTTNYTKIKYVMEDEEELYTLIYVFESGKLIGMKIAAEATGSLMEVSYKQTSKTVSLPNDLDTYELLETEF